MKDNTKIRFTSKERKMLVAMNKTLTVYDLSSKFQVEPRTIGRWLKGENVPPYSTRLMIARMYEEYKNK